MLLQAAISPFYCAMSTALDLSSVTYPQEVSGPDLACTRRVGYEGIWIKGTPRLTMGNPNMNGQATVPALMMSQKTLDHVSTEMGFGWRRTRTWRAGGTLADSTSQMERNECCQLSRCVCSMVENQNRKSGDPGRTSLSHQLWSDSLRQTFSVAAVTSLTITLWESLHCTFILFLSCMLSLWMLLTLHYIFCYAVSYMHRGRQINNK